MRFDRQLDVFGDEHDIAPAHERLRLFEPVKVMPGQTGMAVETLSAPMPGNVELVNRAITSDRCPDCKGSGRVLEWGREQRTCNRCSGSGREL